MDGEAVTLCSDEQLKEFGLVALGDMLALTSFLACRSEADKSLKSQLVGAIKYSSGKNSKRKTYSVILGLKNFNEKLQKYTYVRSAGGSRKLDLRRNIGFEELKQEAVQVYFPENKNSILGSLFLYETKLGNFSGDVIIPGDDFTLEKYCRDNKLQHIRLYLKVKKLTISLLSNALSDDEDIFELPNNKAEDSHTDLIGTSVERKRLREEMNKAYEESLEADRKKDRIVNVDASTNEINVVDEEHSNFDLIKLRKSREERVLEEPSLNDDHVTISIRHTSLGTKVRLFHAKSVFQQVYDWVGSLDLRPKHFILKDYKGFFVSPDKVVMSGSFNMSECDKPIPMSPTGSVAFTGFSTSTRLFNEHFAELQEIRESECEMYSKELYAEVRRENIYEDMISLYRKRNVAKSLSRLNFKNENAVGDGVSRDAFSEFYRTAYRKMEGHFFKVPSPYLDDEELKLIGEIITHGFILFDIFPLALCKLSLKHYLYNHEESDEDMYQSFLSFITPIERELISRFAHKDGEDAQPLIDIFTEYSIFTRPTSQNVRSIVIKAANIALIRQPCFAMQLLVQGMGSFWNKTNVNQMDSLYQLTTPTADDIISILDPEEVCKKDQQVTTWLHRYVRSSNPDELLHFVRFITGSEMMIPGSKIKIEFVDQSEEHLHPITKTCFKILIVPRQFKSFFELRDNLNFYVNQGSWEVHDD